MNVVQMEYAATFTPPLPEQSTLERMEQLFIDWRRERNTALRKEVQLMTFDRQHGSPEEQMADRRNEIVNGLTRAEMRQREIVDEIIEVAGQLYSEHAASEVITQ